MTEPRYQDREWLREQYHGKQQTTREIAERCDVVHGTIETWLHKHDIETRKPGRNPVSILAEHFEGER